MVADHGGDLEPLGSSQYQQNPIPLRGAMVKAAWLKYYDPGEQPGKFDILIQSWDTANKAYKLPAGTDKLMRLHAQTPVFENGHVLLPKSTPWLGDYLNELLSFRGSQYCDQVDSTIQALDHLKLNPMMWKQPRRIPRQRGICGSAVLYAQQHRRHALRYRGGR